jgi:ribonuclease HII
VPRSLGSADRKLLADADQIIGVDEVGRGCLAGPVVVAAVVFDRIPSNPMIQDSKALTPSRREQADVWVRRRCRSHLVVEVWVDVIDRLNILQATRLAMTSCVRTLAGPGSVVVVDQVKLGEMGCRVISSPKADSRYFSVAAASVVAKVHRDRLMATLATAHPEWGWDRNKGYGTSSHRRALQEYGGSYLHRKSFKWSPVLP